MGMTEQLRLLQEMEQKVFMPAGEEKVKKQHEKGKLTARERIHNLFD
jgi:acetyl-CoA carboxylase carboxyltransferase component